MVSDKSIIQQISVICTILIKKFLGIFTLVFVRCPILTIQPVQTLSFSVFQQNIGYLEETKIRPLYKDNAFYNDYKAKMLD